MYLALLSKLFYNWCLSFTHSHTYSNGDRLPCRVPISSSGAIRGSVCCSGTPDLLSYIENAGDIAACALHITVDMNFFHCSSATPCYTLRRNTLLLLFHVWDDFHFLLCVGLSWSALECSWCNTLFSATIFQQNTTASIWFNYVTPLWVLPFSTIKRLFFIPERGTFLQKCDLHLTWKVNQCGQTLSKPLVTKQIKVLPSLHSVRLNCLYENRQKKGQEMGTCKTLGNASSQLFTGF